MFQYPQQFAVESSLSSFFICCSLRATSMEDLAWKCFISSPLSFSNGNGVKPKNPTFKISASLSKSNPKLNSVATDAMAASPRKLVSADSLQFPAGYLGAVPERSGSDQGEQVLNETKYLKSILRSKVYDVAVQSPLQLAPSLSKRLGVNVWLKREDLQPVS